MQNTCSIFELQPSCKSKFSRGRLKFSMDVVFHVLSVLLFSQIKCNQAMGNELDFPREAKESACVSLGKGVSWEIVLNPSLMRDLFLI